MEHAALLTAPTASGRKGAWRQQPKDEVRFERTKDLSNRRSESMEQVTAAAGFTNEKSFTQVFWALTNMSPVEFSKEQERWS